MRRATTHLRAQAERLQQLQQVEGVALREAHLEVVERVAAREARLHRVLLKEIIINK